MTTHPGLDHFRREGWRGQFDRVERWHGRVMTALAHSTDGLLDHDVMDSVYAFFQSAYHLRDWLQNDEAASKAELDDLMRRTPALQLCRAICNGSKHLMLDERQPKAHVRMMQEYVPPSRDHPSGGSRLRLLGFETRDGDVDYAYVDELVNETMAAWRTFCTPLASVE
jgi:hypothetical protein